MSDGAVNVDETIKRLQAQKDVVGVLIMDSKGRVIRSTLDEAMTTQTATLMHQLCDKSMSVVKEMDPTNDLTFLRLRTKKHEIMVAPDRDFLMAVMTQLNPSK
ncbi:hypothetical protein L596_029452 [Steinernema carpocapsae]|nr:hypothetical protein L596_029452 [Steinernema carpocapsae]